MLGGWGVNIAGGQTGGGGPVGGGGWHHKALSKEPALVVEAAVAAHVSSAPHPAEAFGVETFAPVACLAAAPALLPHADATVGSLQKVQHFDPAAVGFAPVVAAVVAVVVAVAKGG